MDSRPDAYSVPPLALSISCLLLVTRQRRPLVSLSSLTIFISSLLSKRVAKPRLIYDTCRPMRGWMNDTMANQRSVKSSALD